MAVAAVALPATAAVGGIPAVFAVLATVCIVAALAVVVWIREPPRAPGYGPQAGDGCPADTHRAQAAAAEPRRAVAGGAPVPGVGVPGRGPARRRRSRSGGRHCCGTLAGRRGRTAGPHAGAGGRRPVGQRLLVRPVREQARTAAGTAIAVGFDLSAILEPGPAPLLAALLVPAAAPAISWNGLVFTAAGEPAPPGRAATAMSVPDTANYVGAALAPPQGGLVTQSAGWPDGRMAGDPRNGCGRRRLRPRRPASPSRTPFTDPGGRRLGTRCPVGR